MTWWVSGFFGFRYIGDVMATKDELLTQYAKLPAFRGFVSADIELYIDLALQAVESYHPKRVKIKEIGLRNDARYPVPSDATEILGAFVKDTNVRIEYREELNATTGDRTYLLLQVQVPSTIELLRRESSPSHYSYPSPYASGFRYGTFAGTGYSSHDLEYTTSISVPDLSARQLMAVRLYCESEAYQFQATKSENLSDITDRESSGASTTLRRSQSGNAFQKLAERKMMEFDKEIKRGYWATDGFGLTQYLWEETRIY